MNQKLSYSSISTFEQCPYKYKLTYIDNHFIEQNTIATCFGTLIHFIEETIANKIKSNEVIDYEELLDVFYNVEDKKEKLFGINKLKEMFPNDYYIEDKNKLSYADKAKGYSESGIYRLETYLKQNPNLKVYGAEIPFDLKYRNYLFHGFIDRVFYDQDTSHYIIEDIKTYSAEIDEQQLKTPLQFVIYSLAFSEALNIPTEVIDCVYDLPLCNVKQKAGTEKYITRGIRKIDNLLTEIEKGVFEPNPSPLCHWCVFSKTYPEQPEEAKKLCPYFCHWTKQNKTTEVEYEWMGEENHEAILEAFIKSLEPTTNKKVIQIQKNTKGDRRFLLRC